MKFNKAILSFLIFSILVGGFVVSYFDSRESADASYLIYCVKYKVNSDRSKIQNIINYVTSDDTIGCPSGYELYNGDFDLNLLMFIENGGDMATDDYDNLGDDGDFMDEEEAYNLYMNQNQNQNQNNTNNNSYNNQNYNYNNNAYDSNPYKNLNLNDYDNYDDSYIGEGVYDDNYINNDYINNAKLDYYLDDYGNIVYDDNPYTNNNQNNSNNSGVNNFNPNNFNGNNYNPNNTNNTNGNNYNPNNPNNTNPNNTSTYNNNFSSSNIIQFDPTLARGRFEKLDPSDYPYCVDLSQEFGYGTNDKMKNREITALQAYLYDRGFLDVEPTGYFGPLTSFALRRFQYRNEIVVSGYVDIEVRDILREITCEKTAIITYKEKPYSPSKTSTKVVNVPKTVAKKTTVIPPTNSNNATSVNKKIIATTTNTSVNKNNGGISTLSSVSGNMYLLQKNNLYFTYNTMIAKPLICITLNNTDCNNPANYGLVSEGILKGYYEVVKIYNSFAFNLYNGSLWGKSGDKVKIYLKDSQNSNSVSIYTINIFN